MAIEPYDPCPCGSEKKLKFCCMDIVRDMEKVIAQQNNGQTVAALKQLNTLHEGYPDNAWVLSMKAIALLNEQRVEEARVCLDHLLEHHPDHSVGIACQAWVRLRMDGYEKSKSMIYRALQRSIQSATAIICAMLQSIAAVMEQRGKVMAMRQHTALALRYAPPEHREALFVSLMELDNDADIPYPLRGVHEPKLFETNDENEKEFRTAMKLASLGCYGMAAKLFDDLVTSNPEAAELNFNAGLCHAWDGDQESAADAFHRASELFEDYDTAVEAESIAQLLDAVDPNFSSAVVQCELAAKDASLLLSKLDDNPQFVRIEQQGTTTQGFQVLGSAPSDEEITADTDISSLPKILGSVTIVDGSMRANNEPAAMVYGMEGETVEAAKKLVLEAADGLIWLEESEETPHQEFDVEYFTDVECIFRLDSYVPPNTNPGVVRQLRQRHREQAIEEEWLTETQSVLDNKTPVDAAGDESLKVKLAATIVALEAQMGRAMLAVDFDALRERLQTEPQSQINLEEDDSVTSFSNMQLFRINPEELSDAKLTEVLNRSLVVGESRTLESMLLQFTKRASVQAEVDMERVYEGLTNIAISKMDDEAALVWIEKAKAEAPKAENAFERELSWAVREATFRCFNPDDPKLMPLLKHLWEHYGGKVPQIREHLVELCKANGISNPPWDSPQLVTSVAEAGGAAPSGGGLWTPGAPDPAADQNSEGGGKLWVPGQD